MKRERELREIMEQAIEEMREVLSRETEEDGAEQWDPDAWEEEVVRFTRRLGQRMVQTWGEVKSEPAKAQALLCLLRVQTPPAAVAVLMVVERLWPD